MQLVIRDKDQKAVQCATPQMIYANLDRNTDTNINTNINTKINAISHP